MSTTSDFMTIAGELAQERMKPEWQTFNLELNEEQQTLRDWVREFSVNTIRPAGAEWDEREEFPWPIVKEAAEIGLYGLESTMSMFLDPTGQLTPIFLEEIFWGDAGIGMALQGTGLAVSAIFGQGTQEQIAEWLPRCYGSASEPVIAAFCSSEPNAGSDVSNVRTTAKYDEATDEWVINGSKSWATNGGIADVHVVIATVDPSLGSRGHAAFIVPMSEIKGISQGAKVKKHGIRASHTADVNLDDARVPGAYLLGGKDKLDARLAKAREGKRSHGNASMATFEASRPAVGAMAIGVARAAYDYALDYAKEREQFGRKIIENQAIAFKLANMKTELDAARPARAARGLDGRRHAARPEGRVPERRGLDGEVQGVGGRRPHHRGGHPDPRRQRLHARVPGGALPPRLEDHDDLRGHLRDPAARDRPHDLGRARPVGPATPAVGGGPGATLPALRRSGLSCRC